MRSGPSPPWPRTIGTWASPSTSRSSSTPTGCRTRSGPPAPPLLCGRGRRLGQVRRFADLVRYRRPDLVHTTLFESDIVGRTGARVARTRVVSSLVNEAYGPDHAVEPGIRASRLRAAQALDALTASGERYGCMRSRTGSPRSCRDGSLYPHERIDVIPRGRDPLVLGRTRSRDRRERARAWLGVDPRHPGRARGCTTRSAEGTRHAGAHVRASSRRAPASAVCTSPVGRARRPRRSCARSPTSISARPSPCSASAATSPTCSAPPTCSSCPPGDEGMPGSVIEAMALETPVVASDLPQVREVAGDCALLVPVGDVDGFARAMLECLKQRDDHGPESRARVHDVPESLHDHRGG